MSYRDDNDEDADGNPQKMFHDDEEDLDDQPENPQSYFKD